MYLCTKFDAFVQICTFIPLTALTNENMMFTDMFCTRPDASVNVQNTSLAHACSSVAAIWNTAYASRLVMTRLGVLFQLV